MKKIVSVITSLIMIFSVIIVPFDINAVDNINWEAELEEYYSFDFSNESYFADKADSATTSILDDDINWQYSPIKIDAGYERGTRDIYPVWGVATPAAIENNWGPQIYTAPGEVTLEDGKTVKTLSVHPYNQTYFVPLKEDGTPLELAPDHKYTIKYSYYVDIKSPSNQMLQCDVGISSDGTMGMNYSENLNNICDSSNRFGWIYGNVGKVVSGTLTVSSISSTAPGYNNKENTRTITVSGTEYTLYNYLYFSFTGGIQNSNTVVDFISLEVIRDDCKGVVELINGDELVKKVELNGGKMSSADMVIPTAPSGKYFSGWYFDKECTNLYTENETIAGVIKLYAGFKEYSDGISIDYTDYNYSAENKVNYPNNYGAEYKGVFPGTGYAKKQSDSEGMLITTERTWGEGTTVVAREENNDLFVVREGYRYTVKLKYKIAEFFSPDSYIKINAGYGIDTSYASDYSTANSDFVKDGDMIQIFTTTDGFVEKEWVYDIKEGDLEGVVPAIGVYVSVPSCQVNDSGQIVAQNKVIIKSLEIVAQKLIKCDVDYNGGHPYKIATVPPTFVNGVENDVFPLKSAYKDGCKFDGWYLDNEFTISAENTLMKEGFKYFAKWCIFGDADDSLEVNTSDLAIMKLHLAGAGEISKGADCNDSGIIDTNDLAMLKLFLAGNGRLGPDEDDWRTHPQDFKLVAFTFDDAPSFTQAGDNITTHIIDTLESYDGRGTLFVTGSSINSKGYKLLEYALSKGFEIENHTYSHPDLTTLSKEQIKEEIVKVNDMVTKNLGITPKFLRPGGLAANSTVYEVTTELNMPVIMQGCATMDYDTSYDAQYVKNVILSNAKDGMIYLCHGWSESTNSCIEEVCGILYEQGYRFVTLEELFRYKGITNIPTDKPIRTVDDAK